MEFRFERRRINKIPREKILLELKRVAKKFNYIEFGKMDFDKFAKISSTTVIKEFGSWLKALNFLKKHLNEKNLNLSPRPYRTKRGYSDKQLFDEMERIWKKLGQRPSKIEWQALKPKISHNTYEQRFNGWTNACLKFIEYKMGKNVVVESKLPDVNNLPERKATVKIRKEDTRTISLKLRLDVLKRDNFRCVFCGRSPATDIGVILHIDHIVPFAKGGKTVLNNLQTLCFECNLGKSDRKYTS